MTTTKQPDRNGGADPAMLDVRGVASLLSCSARHIYRMADAGRMPRPLKLGSLVRWRRADIDAWLEAGCPPCRGKGVAR